MRRRGVCGIAKSMNSETPKKSPLLTSVNQGKKKGQSHYAYYTPTQRTSKREGYWTKQIGTGTWYEVSESWPCAGTLLPSRSWTVWTSPLRLSTQRRGRVVLPSSRWA